jgi:hypothetical protein
MSHWASSDCVSGKSYLWHKKYSLPYTVVLGYVGCRVTSKLCGIGPAKRSWGGVKKIKDGVRSHLGGESTEKRSVIYVTAKIQEARMQSNGTVRCHRTRCNVWRWQYKLQFAAREVWCQYGYIEGTSSAGYLLCMDGRLGRGHQEKE